MNYFFLHGTTKAAAMFESAELTRTIICPFYIHMKWILTNYVVSAVHIINFVHSIHSEITNIITRWLCGEVLIHERKKYTNYTKSLPFSEDLISLKNVMVSLKNSEHTIESVICRLLGFLLISENLLIRMPCKACTS